jgi:ELWxxDGT repeat protein
VTAFTAAGSPGTARWLAAAGDRLFLGVRTEATGEELWTSDGTAAGTRLVVDLRPGAAGAAPQNLAAVGERLAFAADDGISGPELWSSDGTRAGTVRVADVAPGPRPSSPEQMAVAGSFLVLVANDGAQGREPLSLAREAVASNTCQPSATTLCLGGGRFAVTARWQAPNVFPAAGQAQTVPGITTEQTGGFWFFDSANTELVVKILDGGPVNDHFWVFYGALSDVVYQIEVRDLATGLVRTYSNPAGTFCGRADVAAFPIAGSATAALAAPPAKPASMPIPPPDVCHPADPSGLCLGANGRFFVRVAVIPPGAHDPVFAAPLTGTADTGFFWFFDPANLEIAVKVLDGTAVNGHFRVFFGALTDVRYIVTVFDTRTGAVRNYSNPQGQLCGQADVAAF